MAFFSCISDVLKTDVNDLVDCADDPVTLVRQLIVEMEVHYDQATQELGQAMASQKIASKELADARGTLAELALGARIAREQGEAVLADRALEVRVDFEARVGRLRDHYDDVTARVDRMRVRVQELRVRLDEARARQVLVAQRAKMAEHVREAAKATCGAASETTSAAAAGATGGAAFATAVAPELAWFRAELDTMA